MDDTLPPAVSVLIVDDQAPFRGAARPVVGATKGFTIVGEAESGEEAVALVDRRQPGLVLMDINMGGIDGIEATRQITAAHPETMLILVSTYAVADLAADARSCGAAAYVHKEELAPRVLRELWAAGGDQSLERLKNALKTARSWHERNGSFWPRNCSTRALAARRSWKSVLLKNTSTGVRSHHSLAGPSR